MEDRLKRFQDPSTYEPELKRRLEHELRPDRAAFAGVHCFRESSEVPDDESLRLVILRPEYRHGNSSSDSNAIDQADKFLQQRGEQPRQNQNRLVFLAADAGSFEGCRAACRQYLAWRSIVEDKNALNLTPYDVEQAGASKHNAESKFQGMLNQVFKWILAPRKESGGTTAAAAVEWDSYSVDVAPGNRMSTILDKCNDEEVVNARYAPFMLKRKLEQTFFAPRENGELLPHVAVSEVWQACCRYLDWPRLTNKGVLLDTIVQGLHALETFGLASNIADGIYQGIVYGEQRDRINGDELEHLLRPEVAAKAKADALRKVGRTEAAEEVEASVVSSESTPSTQTFPGQSRPQAYTPGVSSQASSSASAKPTKARLSTQISYETGLVEFQKLYNDVIAHLASQYGSKVTIQVDVSATYPEGYPRTSSAR